MNIEINETIARKVLSIVDAGLVKGVGNPKAGVECLAGTNVPDDPSPLGVECECTKFKPSGKRSAPPQPVNRNE